MQNPRDLESLFPDRDSNEPLNRQLARRLRAAIESGLYPASSRLLPRRELAVRLGLAQNTVSAAIEQLISEGYLESRVGSGTYVAREIVKGHVVVEPPLRRLPATAERFELARRITKSYFMRLGPLRAGVPDLGTFPNATWARITRRKLAELSTYLDYKDSQGDPALREAIARHVQQFRGVATDVDRIVIVEGTQAAIRLAADVLVAEGDSALIEDPCYPFALAAFAAKAIALVPVPVDGSGMNVGLAPAAKLAYVSPSNQFPLGSRMSLERRRALLNWARDNDAYVIEDDYDSEFAFDGKPLPTLQSIDVDERVVYVGTFSKTIAPALRLAYLIVPRHLAELFSLARLISTHGGVRYVQATLADFISEGHFARYVHRMGLSYGARRRALVALLKQELPASGFAVGIGNAGLHLSVIAPSDFDDVAVADALAEDDVHVQPLSSFCIERTDCRGFVLGYTAAPMPDVLRAARLFAGAVRKQCGV